MVKRERIFANSFPVPYSCQTGEELYLVRATDLPSNAELAFIVTPTECFGKAGHSIHAHIRTGTL